MNNNININNTQNNMFNQTPIYQNYNMNINNNQGFNGMQNKIINKNPLNYNQQNLNKNNMISLS